MYFEEDQELPNLIPISRKKRIQSALPEPESTASKPLPEQSHHLKPEPTKAVPNRQGRKSQRDSKEAELAKIEEFDMRFKAMNEQVKKKEEEQKIKMTDKFKQTQKAKTLIDEILHKINAKNVTEELYPVTNETIEALIKKADAEIAKLNAELQRRESSLTLNPNNLNLKAEVQGLKSSIDRAVTIKELYHEKINQRNKIMTLQRTIIGLKEENANLKIKINRGIETIQKHMHNLPCEKEKELLLELQTLKSTHQKEKEMRAQLESNISDIVLNFKRLYEEADTARLIVTRKLADILEKQKLASTNNFHPHHHSSEERNTPKNSPAVSGAEERTKMSLKAAQIKNFSPSAPPSKTPPKNPVLVQNNKSTVSRPAQPILAGMFSLQDQIKKMRANQRTHVKQRG